MAEMSIGAAVGWLAERDPDRAAITHEGVTVTRSELDRRTNRLARAYADLGVKQDDLVTVGLPNGIEFYEACIATWKLGATPQPNEFSPDWPEFFATQRLGFQVELAEKNGYGGRVTRGVRRVIDRLPELLAHKPRPSLLHGDFWSGNHGMLPDGTPVVFDPAIHYGDRECDLAMAALFGGFHPAFFDAYIEAWPMAAGWEKRWKVYQLYHVLNHLNLFGGAYLAQAEAMLDRLLAEV